MTAVSAEAAATYAQLNRLWPRELPALTAPEAIKAATKLYRAFMGKPFTGSSLITSGNRSTVMTTSRLVANPDKGWRELVHHLSHWFHSYLGTTRPHGAEHAKLELRMVKHVIEAGWLAGSLAPKPRASRAAKPKPDPRAERLAHTEAAIKRWTAKLRRAETAIKKLNRSLAAQRRAAASREIAT